MFLSGEYLGMPHLFFNNFFRHTCIYKFRCVSLTDFAWVHKIDLGYKHDFTFRAGQTKHTIQLSFDMKNVLNFFNSSWGVSKILNPAIGSDARILEYKGVDADGYATFSTIKAIDGNTQTWTPNHAIGQCWNVAIGIKYIFN